jgi:hypothetical protein
MRYLLLPVLLLGLAACSSAGTNDVDKGEPAAFSIHLQSAYNNTPVLVELDGEVVLEDTLSTDPITGLARSFPVDVEQGTHRVEATVNGRIGASRTFTVGDTLNVAVNYDPERERIIFGAQRDPYLYY